MTPWACRHHTPPQAIRARIPCPRVFSGVSSAVNVLVSPPSWFFLASPCSPWFFLVVPGFSLVLLVLPDVATEGSFASISCPSETLIFSSAQGPPKTWARCWVEKRQQEEERKAKHARMEAEREKVRQTIRDKVASSRPPSVPLLTSVSLSVQYGLKKKEEKEAEEKAAMEQACEGSLTRPKKAIPRGCGEDEEDEESILDTVLKFLPGPIQDIFKK